MPARKRAAEAAADEANAGVELAAYGTSAGTSTAPPPAPLHCLECGKSCATPFAMEMHFRKWPVSHGWLMLSAVTMRLPCRRQSQPLRLAASPRLIPCGVARSRRWRHRVSARSGIA